MTSGSAALYAPDCTPCVVGLDGTRSHVRVVAQAVSGASHQRVLAAGGKGAFRGQGLYPLDRSRQWTVRTLPLPALNVQAPRNKAHWLALTGSPRAAQAANFGEREVLLGMPYDLRSQVMEFLYRDIMSTNPIFADAEKVFVTEVCSRLVPISFSGGSYIYQKG